MNRRDWMRAMLAAAAQAAVASPVPAGVPRRRTLILVELRGGNDGLNTLVDLRQDRYAALRPRLALGADERIALDDAHAIHAALRPVMPMWAAGEWAWIQGVGYASPSLSHFRSGDIWATASDAGTVLAEGWVGRSLRRQAGEADSVAEAVDVGRGDAGPLAAPGVRVLSISDPGRFRRQARGLAPGAPASGALGHLLAVEAEVARAASRLRGGLRLATAFPAGGFGQACRVACEVLAEGAVPALRLGLSGFDTHRAQKPAHARVLAELSAGLAALRTGLVEIGRWHEVVVLGVSEFGRRAAENGSGGTDHGAASVAFAVGGAVRGGYYGAPVDLERLDALGNPVLTTDFRRLMATVLEQGWGQAAAPVLGPGIAPLGFL